MKAEEFLNAPFADKYLDAPKAEEFLGIEIKKIISNVIVKSEPAPKRLINSYVKTEKIKLPLTEDEIASIVRNELAKLPKPKPEKVIEKIIEKKIIKEVKEEEKKDDKKYAEESQVKEATKKLEDISKQFEGLKKLFMVTRGGSGVIGIPPPEGNNGKVLTVYENRAQWRTSSGGSSPDAYTTSNVTTTRNLDPTTSTIDDLYNVVASLIVSLQGAGIIQ